MEKSKNQKNKVRFVVVREFSGEKSMREAFEQLIERQTLSLIHICTAGHQGQRGGAAGSRFRRFHEAGFVELSEAECRQLELPKEWIA